MTRGGLFRSAVGAALAVSLPAAKPDLPVPTTRRRLADSGILFKPISPNTEPFAEQVGISVLDRQVAWDEPTITRAELREIFGYDDV